MGYINETDYSAVNITKFAYDCSDRTCKWGSSIQQQTVELISAWGPLIYAGCFAATLSSGISSMEGAPRIFQAIAKDEIVPGIKWFAPGYGKANMPLRGYLLCFIVAEICILITDLNIIAGKGI